MGLLRCTQPRQKFLFACSFGYFVRLPLHGLHSSRGLALLAQVVVGFRPPTSCSPLVSYHQAKIRGERQGITEAIGTMKHGRQNAVAQQHPKDTYTPLIYANMYPARPSQQHLPQSPGGMPSWWVGPPLPPGPRPTTPPPTPPTTSHHPTLPQPNTHVHGHPSNHTTPLISIKLTEKPRNTVTITSFVHTSTAPPTTLLSSVQFFVPSHPPTTTTNRHNHHR